MQNIKKIMNKFRSMENRPILGFSVQFSGKKEFSPTRLLRHFEVLINPQLHAKYQKIQMKNTKIWQIGQFWAFSVLFRDKNFFKKSGSFTFYYLPTLNVMQNLENL